MNYFCNQLILKMDLSTKITQIITNAYPGLKCDVGSSIVHIFSEGSLQLFYDNFSKAQEESSSLGFYAKLANGVYSYVFLVNHEIDMTIFAINTNPQAAEMFDEIMVLNNEHINSIRALYKKVSKLEDNIVFFEEIMKLNNSLINVKRELSVKNKELERLNQELKDINYIDYLTRISNRRKFFVDVYELVKKDNYLLTMLDFNHFKAINDEYGHQRGDEALVFFAERLKQELQDFGGHIYRLGGDEFAFLVLEKMPLDREKLFEKIDKELKQFHQLASIAHGTVLITNDTCNEVLKAEHSMAKADQLMYEMKTKYYKANDLVLRKKD